MIIVLGRAKEVGTQLVLAIRQLVHVWVNATHAMV